MLNMRQTCILLLLFLLCSAQIAEAQRIYVNFTTGKQLAVITDEGGGVSKVMRSDGKAAFEDWLVGESLTGEKLSYRDGLWTYVFESLPSHIVKRHQSNASQSEVFVYATSRESPQAPLNLVELYSDQLTGSYVSVTEDQLLSVAGNHARGFTFQLKMSEEEQFKRLKPLTFNAQQLQWVLREPDKPAAFFTLRYVVAHDDTRYFEMRPSEGEPVRFMLQ